MSLFDDIKSDISIVSDYAIRREFKYLGYERRELLVSLRRLYSRSKKIIIRINKAGIKTNRNIQREILDLADSIINEQEFNQDFLSLYNFITEGSNSKEILYPPGFYIKDLLNKNYIKVHTQSKIKIQSYLLAIGLTPDFLKENPSYVGDATKIVKATLTFMTKYNNYIKQKKKGEK